MYIQINIDIYYIIIIHAELHTLNTYLNNLLISIFLI